MTSSDQPTSGSLFAKIIRACQVHANRCSLECPERRVEELGKIASFDDARRVVEKALEVEQA